MRARPRASRSRACRPISSPRSAWRRRRDARSPIGETSYETNRVAILTDGFWRRALNARSARHRPLDPHRRDRVPVVGILPPEFQLPFIPRGAVSAARIDGRRTLVHPTALWQRADDRALASSGVARPGAGRDRRAQCRTRSRSSDAPPRWPPPASVRWWSPLHGDHVASVRGILLAAHERRARPAPDRRRQRDQSLSDPRQRPVEELAVRQALGASRRHVMVETLVETMAIVRDGRGSWHHPRSRGASISCNGSGPSICRWAAAWPSIRAC